MHELAEIQPRPSIGWMTWLLNPLGRPIGLFVLTFAIRMGYTFLLAPAEHYDPGEMEFAAATLATKGFVGNVYSDTSGPSAHVAPAYVTLLGGVYWLFGYETLAGRLAQHILAAGITALTVAFIPATARALRFSPRAASITGIVLAVCPVYWFDETAGSWEQPLVALALLATILVFARLHNSGWEGFGHVLLAGVLMGLGGLISPVLLASGGFMFAAELIHHSGKRRRVLKAGVVAMLFAALLIAPWTIRNYRELGSFVLIRSNFGLELWIGNNPDSNGKTCTTSWFDKSSPFNKLHPLANAAQRERLEGMGEVAYMQEQGSKARAWIESNPGRATLLTGRRFLLFWFPPPEMWEPTTSFRTVRTLILSLITLGMLFGLFRLYRSGYSMTGLLIGALASFTFVYCITHVDVRYRYPVHALSVLIACHGLITLVTGGPSAVPPRSKG